MSDDRSSALIGYTGFVGGNLLRQRSFDALFNSSNIEQIAGRSFDLVVCSGAPAEKWKANAQPERDLANIERLVRALEEVNAEKLVLASTVDVFLNPNGVDEDSPVPMEGLHAYGRHRRLLEELVAARFDALIVRLPALYGEGLKKNIIYDLLHDNDVHKVDSRGVFQFYNLDHLWRDIEVALDNELAVIHLATEPVSVADVARVGFGIDFKNEIVPTPARYDMHTKHAALYGETGPYIENVARELAGIADFVARERQRRG
ncbi:MAG TPA: NAD-dependent epimerase/dehydratase family protein [Gemmatimonadaceae bacterium]